MIEKENNEGVAVIQSKSRTQPVHKQMSGRHTVIYRVVFHPFRSRLEPDVTVS